MSRPRGPHAETMELTLRPRRWFESSPILFHFRIPSRLFSGSSASLRCRSWRKMFPSRLCFALIYGELFSRHRPSPRSRGAAGAGAVSHLDPVPKGSRAPPVMPGASAPGKPCLWRSRGRPDCVGAWGRPDCAGAHRRPDCAGAQPFGLQGCSGR